MSEESKNQDPGEILQEVMNAEESVETQDVQTGDAEPVEDQARAQGWTDKETFIKRGGKADDWVDAKEFVDRGPIYDHIKKLNKRLSTMAEHNQKIMSKIQEAETRGYEKALRQLQQQREEAEELGETKVVKQIDAQTQEIQQRLQQSQQSNVPKEAMEFAQRNKDWFMKDQRLTQYAVGLDATIRQEFQISGQDFDESDIMAELDKRLSPVLEKAGYKTKAAEKAVEAVEDEAPKKRKTAPPVSGGRSRAKSSKESYTEHDLTNEAREIYAAMKMAIPDLSIDDWVAQNKAVDTDGSLMKSLIRED